MWPNIFGLRPAFREMADRLAAAGYAVPVPNPFFRDVKRAVVKEDEDLSAAIQRLLPYMRNITPEDVVTDATAFAAWIEAPRRTASSPRSSVWPSCVAVERQRLNRTRNSRSDT